MKNKSIKNLSVFIAIAVLLALIVTIALVIMYTASVDVAHACQACGDPHHDPYGGRDTLVMALAIGLPIAFAFGLWLTFFLMHRKKRDKTNVVDDSVNDSSDGDNNNIVKDSADNDDNAKVDNGDNNESTNA